MRYIQVTKPGIILGNIITLTGGYFLGSNSHITTYLLTVIGMALVVAAGCVFNNCIDRDIDRLMQRTQKRVMVIGAISLKAALAYGMFLGIAGLLILYLAANLLTALIAFIGLIVSVGLYTLGLKRRSIHGVTAGGIAGAIPPVVGYCAATNRIDLGALLVFLILFFWQIPHFYAIAIFRLKDYTAALIPVLPAKKSKTYTKITMLIHVVAFAIVAILPVIFGYSGWIYGCVALLLSVYWLQLAVRGLWTKNDYQWSRKMFGASILIITILCFAMVA